jgi:imidazole glycerol-phosphate synthase subunit HisH
MSAPPLIAVLDYGIGNLRSAQKALQHCGADARLTVDHGLIEAADAVVLPGVGAFGACMAALRDADLCGHADAVRQQ